MTVIGITEDDWGHTKTPKAKEEFALAVGLVRG